MNRRKCSECGRRCRSVLCRACAPSERANDSAVVLAVSDAVVTRLYMRSCSLAAVLGRDRHPHVVEVRYVVWAVLRDRFCWQVTRIAAAFGRTHGPVIEGLRRVHRELPSVISSAVRLSFFVGYKAGNSPRIDARTATVVA